MEGLDIVGVLYDSSSYDVKLGYFITGTTDDGKEFNNTIIAFARILQKPYLKALNKRGWVFTGVGYNVVGANNIPYPNFKNIINTKANELRSTSLTEFNDSSRRIRLVREIGVELKFSTKDAERYREIREELVVEAEQPQVDANVTVEHKIEVAEQLIAKATTPQKAQPAQSQPAENSNRIMSMNERLGLALNKPEQPEPEPVTQETEQQVQQEQAQPEIETQAQPEQQPNQIEEQGGTQVMAGISDDFRKKDSFPFEGGSSSNEGMQVKKRVPQGYSLSEKGYLYRNLPSVADKSLYNFGRDLQSTAHFEGNSLLPQWNNKSETHNELVRSVLQGVNQRVDKSAILSAYGVTRITTREQLEQFMVDFLEGKVSYSDPRAWMNFNWYVHPNLLHNSLTDWYGDELLQTFLQQKSSLGMHYKNILKSIELFKTSPSPLLDDMSIEYYNQMKSIVDEYPDTARNIAFALHYLSEEPIEGFDHCYLGSSTTVKHKVIVRKIDKNRPGTYQAYQQYLPLTTELSPEVLYAMPIEDYQENNELGYTVVSYLTPKFEYIVELKGAVNATVTVTPEGRLVILSDEILKANLEKGDTPDAEQEKADKTLARVYFSDKFTARSNTGEYTQFPMNYFEESMINDEERTVFSLKVRPLVEKIAKVRTLQNPMHAMVNAGLTTADISAVLKKIMPKKDFEADMRIATNDAQQRKYNAEFDDVMEPLYLSAFDYTAMHSPDSMQETVDLIKHYLLGNSEFGDFQLILKDIQSQSNAMTIINLCDMAIKFKLITMDNLLEQLSRGDVLKAGLDLGLPNRVMFNASSSVDLLENEVQKTVKESLEYKSTKVRGGDNPVYPCKIVAVVTDDTGTKHIGVIISVFDIVKKSGYLNYYMSLVHLKNAQLNLGSLYVENAVIEYNRVITSDTEVFELSLGDFVQSVLEDDSYAEMPTFSISDYLALESYIYDVYLPLVAHIREKGHAVYIPTPFEIATDYSQPVKTDGETLYKKRLDSTQLEDLIKVDNNGNPVQQEVQEYVLALIKAAYMGHEAPLPPVLERGNVNPQPEAVKQPQPVQPQPVQTQPQTEEVVYGVVCSVCGASWFKGPNGEKCYNGHTSADGAYPETKEQFEATQMQKRQEQRMQEIQQAPVDVQPTQPEPTQPSLPEIKKYGNVTDTPKIEQTDTPKFKLGLIAYIPYEDNNPSSPLVGVITSTINSQGQEVFAKISMLNLVALVKAKTVSIDVDMYEQHFETNKDVTAISYKDEEIYPTIGYLVNAEDPTTIKHFDNEYKRMKAEGAQGVPPLPAKIKVEKDKDEEVSKAIEQVVTRSKAINRANNDLFKHVSKAVNVKYDLIAIANGKFIFSNPGSSDFMMEDISKYVGQDSTLQLLGIVRHGDTYLARFSSGRVAYLDLELKEII